ELFELIETFAGYGFNKSHSAAYAMIAFQTAYLKAHFPEEFMAAVLTSEMNSSDNVAKYIAECRNMNISILPPDINESDKGFTVVDGKIRFGLAAVKNVGESAIDSILEIRSRERFASVFDFCRRVDLRKVNKRVLESLIQCGAFDSTGYTRAALMAAAEDAIDYGQRVQKEKNDPQMSLFGGGGNEADAVNAPGVEDIPEWDEKHLLELEKEAIGFYITGHPLDEYRDVMEKYANVDALSIKEDRTSDQDIVRIGGIIKNIKTIMTKKGDPMAFVDIEDIHGAVEVTVFPKLYAAVQDLLAVDTPVFVQGQVQKNENSAKILADSLVRIDEAESRWAASLHIRVDTESVQEETLGDLLGVLQKYPGPCRGFLHVCIPAKTETVISLPEEMKLKAGVDLRQEVNSLLGYEAVYTICAPVNTAQQSGNGNGKNEKNGRNGKKGKKASPGKKNGRKTNGADVRMKKVQ
ncbi:MAG: OB-fold nucleic acid binding domain-containing protein, partial [Desulfosalsimonas sp.]